MLATGIEDESSLKVPVVASTNENPAGQLEDENTDSPRSPIAGIISPEGGRSFISPTGPPVDGSLLSARGDKCKDR